ncbi:MAG: head-tail connector protein [Pseudomonadota bacterium]
MSAIMIAEPAAEPVTLGETKDYLRVDDAESDAGLERLIAAARTCVEGMTRRALIAQAWRYLTPAPKDNKITVPGTPLRQVTAVRLFGPEGSVTTLDPQDYVVSMGAPATIHLRQGRSDATGAEVDAEIGYGPAASDVPADLRQAVLQLVAHWFERREPITAGTFNQVPMTVTHTTAPYRVVGL